IGLTCGVIGVPPFLNSREPSIKSIRDFKPEHRIAVPSLKVLLQAIMLQIAAAKEWGQAEYQRLDPLMVAMAPVDATTALVTGAAGVTAVFSTPPFQEYQIKQPGIHTVLTGEDIMDGPFSGTCMYSTKQFVKENPIAHKA